MNSHRWELMEIAKVFLAYSVLAPLKYSWLFEIVLGRFLREARIILVNNKGLKLLNLMLFMTENLL